MAGGLGWRKGADERASSGGKRLGKAMLVDGGGRLISERGSLKKQIS